MLTGVGLTGDVSLRMMGGDSIHFDVSPKTITPEKAAQGVEVTLSFFPYSAGWLSTSLVISSPDVETQVVEVTGYGIKTGAYLYPSEDSLSFHAEAGRSVIKRVGVLKRNFDGWIASPGVHASGDVPPIGPIVLSPVLAEITGLDSCNFSVMSTTVTNISSTCDSVVFIVSYNPVEVGTHTANLVLSTPILKNSHPAHPVTIPLTGVATEGSLAGDMNGDGQLTVSDVILLINDLINLDRVVTGNPAGDVNSDGDVNITDVVKLIDMILRSE